MRFSLATTVALLPFLGFASANCDKGPFISTLAGVGFDKTPAPEHFCDSQWEEGAVITGVRVWSAKFHIKAIQFQYAGGDWGARHGSIGDDVTPDERTWKENDTIGLRLWPNKPDDGDPMDAVGKLVISQPGQKDFEAGGSKTGKEIYVDNPSGKLLAVKASSRSFSLHPIHSKCLFPRFVADMFVLGCRRCLGIISGVQVPRKRHHQRGHIVDQVQGKHR